MSPLIMTPEGEDGPLKKWLVAWGWIFFVVNIVAIAVVFVHFISFSNAKWAFYCNAWLPLAWSRITAFLTVIMIADWWWPGQTVATLMDIGPDSRSEDKRTAMWFLLGIGALAVWATKGQF